MSKEIDIRALMNNELNSDYIVENCSSFINDVFGDKIDIRSFNDQLTWSTIKQTNFIESAYMGCELPLIIILEVSKNPVRYLLVDGLNRFLTIKRFLNDDLRLCKNGLQKATFLEKKVFSELNEDEREYFLNRGIQVLKYSINTKEKNLTLEEIDAIAKQLYIRYNSGIKLKNEEIQKADYQDDWVTQKIELKLRNEEFLELLKTIYFTPRKPVKTYIEKTLMYCRVAITSCYAPLVPFCKQKSIAKRIDTFYKSYTAELNKENIIKDFEETVICLSEFLKRQYLDEYPELQNQDFMFVTYWLLFQLRKNSLLELNKFDWQHYISYFGNRERINPLFSYYRINCITRYNEVIEYIKDNYKIDLYNYLPVEIEDNNKDRICNFHDLPKYNFQLARDGITVSALLDSLKKNSFILKPPYQRREINDKLSSSFLIESILLNINIPDILVYRHKINEDKVIFEVVDGQQRCWSLLAFLNQRYKNIYGEEVKSEKEGFALKGLTILSELNDKKVKSLKNNLSQEKIEKIKNGKIRVVYIPEEENPYFSVKDYFTRINKTIQPLKKASYRYWNVKYDSKLMKIADTIAQKYKERLLPRMDSKYLPQQYIVNFAFLFYTNQKQMKGFSVQQVCSWLYNFERKKNDLIIHNNEEKVEEIRQMYEVSFEKVDLFLGKILNWLNILNKTINDLISVKYNKSFTNLLCIYYLLADINEADLCNNAERIYEIINNFYRENLTRIFRTDEDIKIIKNCKDLLSPFYMRTIKQNQFKEHLKAMI